MCWYLDITYNIIKEKGEFVINLTTKKLAFATDWCGVKTGAKVDKFKEMKLTKQKCEFIQAPAIAESPVSIECKVTDIKEMGSHHMFIADVTAVHADKKYMDENNKFNLNNSKLVTYSHGSYFSLGKKCGTFGFSVKKNSST